MTNDEGSNTDADRLALLLISRLERLSADSYWAHQASGLRGSLLRGLEERTGEPGDVASLTLEGERLAGLIQRGFEVLEKAARAIQ
jgi:hypothetical protein